MKTTIVMILSIGLLFSGAVGCKKNTDTQAQNGQAAQFTQSYKIESKTFTANLRRLAPPKPGESSQALVLRFFVDNGVVMEPPSAVMLDEIGNRLLVRAAESERKKIQALFERIEKGL